MFVDYHMHTDFSPDSPYPMEKEILDAIELGMDEICFTDHVDYGMKKVYLGKTGEIVDNTDKTYDYFPEYYHTIEEFREKYADKITIKTGQEFGLQKHVLDKFEKLYDSYDYDFVLLSVHSINGEALWLPDFKQGKSQVEYNMEYYEALYDLVKSFKHYSVLAHLDVVNRRDEHGPMDFEVIKPIVTKILNVAIADGKGIELNTSSARFDVGELTPCTEILKLYHDLGGKIITIGSDSHRPGQLGIGYKENVLALKKIGFKQFCTFEKMQPVFHDL
ncbi:MAG: histidinol-phosphatase HisJ family protein [Coriobacteriia bacterium]|nr:histidinol-phosphatase HisJ family protein [Coriobacteriia bacterium]